jgi:hypothetical protein
MRRYENMIERLYREKRNAAVRRPMHIDDKEKFATHFCSQAGVMLLPERVLVVRVPVVASLRELAGGRVLDLVGRLDELHAETFADVPCDVTVETRRGNVSMRSIESRCD